MHTGRDARPGPGTPSATPADPLTGRLLDGRYRIGERIARGGMASVYEATDIRLERTVAIKVMHPGLGDDDDFAARFVREARAAARLSHPHVVAVHDQGTDGEVVFLAMELVRGHTLRDTIARESPLPPARALALLEQVLSALSAAHRAGLVHRDVKPENVLITTDGRVKVADFGLAKAVSAETQHTATGGVLIGTVSYLAPELVLGARADARADVYAAGVLLYELLTGRKPHAGETPIQVAYKHVHADVPAPSALVPGVAPYVDALVARATARDRDQRPADAAVLLHHLRRVAVALAEGLDDDPELTDDLRPRPAGTPEAGPLLEPTAPYQLLGDDAADPEQTRAVPGPAREHTALHRTAEVPTGPAEAPGRDRGDGPARAPRRRRGLAVLLVALLVAGTLGGGAWWFGWARYTEVPGVVSLGQDAAVERLEAAGLEVELGEPAYSETVEAGVVIASEPGAGSRVLDDGTVTLTVSRGKERYELPDLAGKTRDEAASLLAGSKLEVGQTHERYSETVPAGAVLRSDPAAGTVLAPGAAVELWLSRGRRPIRVGDWVGRSYAEARTTLTDRGLKASVSAEEFSDDVAKGRVIRQETTERTLFRGDTVSFVVSKGPELVAVPGGLIASGVDAATAKLEAAGFKVKVTESPTYIGLRYVLRVSPGSGDKVPKGSTITLWLV